jgi:hypothetical protein
MGHEQRPQSCRGERCHDDCVGSKRRSLANGHRRERVQVPLVSPRGPLAPAEILAHAWRTLPRTGAGVLSKRRHFACVGSVLLLAAAACSTNAGRGGIGSVDGSSAGTADATNKEPESGGPIGDKDQSAEGAGEADGGGNDSVDASGLSAQQACSDWATSVCGTYQACLPFYLRLAYADASSCISRTTLFCVAAFGLSGSDASPALVEACARSRLLSCVNYLSNNFPAACTSIHGSVASGDPCVYDWQCAGTNAYCDLGQSGCGVCAQRSAAGGRCTLDNDCQDNLRCTNFGLCATPVGQGAACDAVQNCQGGLVCSNGMCAPQPSEGSPCSTAAGSTEDCDAYFGLAQGLYRDGSHCTQGQVADAGGTCGATTFCAYAATCDTAGATAGMGTCPALAGDGTPCAGPHAPSCQPPAVCGPGGTCQLLPSTSSCP